MADKSDLRPSDNYIVQLSEIILTDSTFSFGPELVVEEPAVPVAVLEVLVDDDVWFSNVPVISTLCPT
jgi:hypothetical protein